MYQYVMKSYIYTERLLKNFNQAWSDTNYTKFKGHGDVVYCTLEIELGLIAWNWRKFLKFSNRDIKIHTIITTSLHYKI